MDNKHELFNVCMCELVYLGERMYIYGYYHTYLYMYIMLTYR